MAGEKCIQAQTCKALKEDQPSQRLGMRVVTQICLAEKVEMERERGRVRGVGTTLL